MFKSVNTLVVLACVLMLAVFLSATAYAGNCQNRAINGICLDRQDTQEGPIAGKPEAEWGIQDEVVQKIAGSSFNAYSSDQGYDDYNGWRYRTSGWYWFDASLHIQSGAILDHFHVEVYDNDASYDIQAWLFSCPSLGSCVTYPTSDCKTSGASASPTWLTCYLPANFVVDNYNNSYYIRVRVGGTTNATRFRAVEMAYHLQVSPAPSTATFTDVPTSHVFFRYVEALAKSGITTGCTATQYCPDQAVTRGQMAVFLSRLVGLHYPH